MDLDTLFIEDDNKEIKFFLQQTLNQDVSDKLTRLIQEHGGVVTDKVPLKGYILIQPGSEDGQRLKDAWSKPDRPSRFFVPFTFVQSCIQAKKLLKPIFVWNGCPILFHVHGSIQNRNQREKAADRILCCGGDPYASEEDAQVIIANSEARDEWNELLRLYEYTENKFVEPPSWIKACMENDSYEHAPLVHKNKGGRIQGSIRNEYTEEEDRLLAHYIARRIPHKDLKGRTGNKIYQELYDMAKKGDRRYQWALRHTWQSWLNRYRKNTKRINTMIDAHVKEKGIKTGEKGQYGFVQQAPPSSMIESDSSPRGSPETGNTHLLNGTNTKQPSNTSHINDSSELLTGKTNLQGGSTLTGDATGTHYAEQDNEWGSQWMTRDGRDDPPTWSKRPIMATTAAMRSRDLHRQSYNDGLIPPVEQELQTRIEGIANEFRWHIDEVWEEYGRLNGQLEETRKTIRSYRDLINEKKEMV